MAAQQTKPVIVEYEVYLTSGEKFVFRAEKGKLFVFNGEWVAIPSAAIVGNKPIYVPRDKVSMVVVNG